MTFYPCNNLFDFGSHYCLQKGIQHIAAGIFARRQIPLLSNMGSERQHWHGRCHLQKKLLVRLIPESRGPAGGSCLLAAAAA
ncbi:hypothetical protein D3C71_1775800 [compost metagenome]